LVKAKTSRLGWGGPSGGPSGRPSDALELSIQDKSDSTLFSRWGGIRSIPSPSELLGGVCERWKRWTGYGYAMTSWMVGRCERAAGRSTELELRCPSAVQYPEWEYPPKFGSTAMLSSAELLVSISAKKTYSETVFGMWMPISHLHSDEYYRNYTYPTVTIWRILHESNLAKNSARTVWKYIWTWNRIHRAVFWFWCDWNQQQKPRALQYVALDRNWIGRRLTVVASSRHDDLEAVCKLRVSVLGLVDEFDFS
jgi:hypothetical protein